MLAPAESVADRADPRPAIADPDDLAGALEQAILALRPEYRLVFVLFHEQNLMYEEIAQAQGAGEPARAVAAKMRSARPAGAAGWVSHASSARLNI